MLKRMKKEMDERRQLQLTAVLMGLVLLAAILIPLAFRVPPSPTAEPEDGPAEPDLEHRAALFVEYWAHGLEGEAEVETLIPDREMETFCENVMRKIVAEGTVDQAWSYSMPTGREYVTVTDAGGEVKLCRMWVQERGDWQNWIDACFDAQSGRIYYLYVSRECLTNRALYGGPTEDRDSAEAVARSLAEAGGDTLRMFSGDKRGGTALIRCDGGQLCYEITWAWYDALVDIRILCL